VKESQKNIVVPVDFSENSENTISGAILLSKQNQSKIHLVNVIEFNDWWNNIIINKELREKLNEMALQNIKSLTEKYPEVNFETVVLFGRRHEQILSYAESINAIFIVLYDKHKDENESKILGSTVTHIVTESKCPVITIKNKIVDKIQNIIVPIDLSDNTELQLNSAIEFHKLNNAHLHFVSVLFKGRGTSNLRIKAKAQQLKSKLKDLQVPFKISLIKKQNTYAYQDILEFSNRENADLIIIMTHKENYGFDTYIGAFAHQIINLSDAPVMTITSTAAKSNKENILNKFVDPLGVFKS
jgi:nucleotide-binding universal stress UspA family protein